MANKSGISTIDDTFLLLPSLLHCYKNSNFFLTVSVSRFSLVEKVLNVILIALPFDAVIIHWHKIFVGYSSGKFGESIDLVSSIDTTA